jgi:hypothetical protein
MKPITAIIKEKGGAKTYPCNEEVTMNADGSGGPVSIAKQVRKAKNPATRPTNKVTESYNEKRSKRRGSGNYLPKVENSPLPKKDACYSKVKSRYKKWPSAYASGALVKCRKVGAANWGNKSKK